MSGTIITGVQATGKIKYYQLTVGGILLLNLPISYLFVKFGYPAYSVMIITNLVSIIAFSARFLFLYKLLNIKIKDFFDEVICKCFIICILSVFVTYYLNKILNDSFVGFVLLSISSYVITIIFIYNFGLNSSEKRVLINSVKNKIWSRF